MSKMNKRVYGVLGISSIMANAHPESSANLANALPLNDSPFKAINKEPSGQFRLSVVTDWQSRKIW